MKKIFIGIILSIIALILRIIIIVIEMVYYMISSVGDFIMGLIIISSIYLLFCKDYEGLQLNIIGLVVIIIFKFGAELIITSLHLIEEWIDEYRCRS